MLLQVGYAQLEAKQIYFNKWSHGFRVCQGYEILSNGLTNLITVAESRTNSVFREIERRRATFAQLLREQVEDSAKTQSLKPSSPINLAK